MTPLISVIIPIYNVESILLDAWIRGQSDIY